MYLLELFINDDHALASKNTSVNNKKVVILFEKLINLKMPDDQLMAFPLGDRLHLQNIKESTQFFTSKQEAEIWAKEFKKDYKDSIDKDSNGNYKFSYLITKLNVGINVPIIALSKAPKVIKKKK